MKITLRDIRPPIWRQLLVPGGIKLAKLHEIFQVAMGWTNAHLHNFTIGDQRYGPHFDDFGEHEIDEKTVTVAGALGKTGRFGDGWEHEVEVMESAAGPLGLKRAVCLDGRNACPPDDCGGVPGYELLLEALADPNHEEHETMKEWVGEPFDAKAFDLISTNVILQRLL